MFPFGAGLFFPPDACIHIYRKYKKPLKYILRPAISGLLPASSVGDSTNVALVCCPRAWSTVCKFPGCVIDGIVRVPYKNKIEPLNDPTAEGQQAPIKVYIS